MLKSIKAINFKSHSLLPVLQTQLHFPSKKITLSTFQRLFILDKDCYILLDFLSWGRPLSSEIPLDYKFVSTSKIIYYFVKTQGCNFQRLCIINSAPPTLAIFTCWTPWPNITFNCLRNSVGFLIVVIQVQVQYFEMIKYI